MTVTDAQGNVTYYEYDPAGRLSSITRPDGSREERTYDKAGNLLKQLDETSAGEVIHAYEYIYDSRGNIIERRGLAQGNLSLLTDAVMTYDADNRMISYNGETVTYDANGNMLHGPLDGTMADYTYDCRNRLISVTTKEGDFCEYAYDAENNRIRKQERDTKTEYVLDPEAQYSQVLTETVYEKSLAGLTWKQTEIKTHTYGSGLISTADSKGTHYYHYNNIGSTTEITDAGGSIEYQISYGIYGELLGIKDASGKDADQSQTGLTFLYNGFYGVQSDTNGLYYMRARYYNPQIKRFINRDILSGDITDSTSLNRYTYVNGNPVSLVDPFGLCAQPSVMEQIHKLLDILGWVFDAADGLNALLYLAEGDYANAAASAIGLLPLGDIFGKGLKLGLGAAGAVGRFGAKALKNAGEGIVQGIGKMFARVGKEAAEEGLEKFGKKVFKEAAGEGAQKTAQRVGEKTLDIADGACFVAGTQIKTLSGQKNIEDLQVGDLVYAKNAETGECAYKKIVRLFERESDELILLEIGDIVITTTPTHPFWVGGYGFKPAVELTEGEEVENASGETLPVKSVQRVKPDKPVKVYNFEVEDWHTYYVSEEEVLVHNSCMADPSNLTQNGEKNFVIFNKTHNGAEPKNRAKVKGSNGGKLQSHHGLQAEWAEANLKQYGYSRKLAPTITIETGKGHPHTIISNA